MPHIDDNPHVELISFDLCPYVQRAAIALAEKGVAFERVDIDLAAKPDWFKAISPLGKVPLLKVGEDVLFESAAIVEYLDEAYAPALHPREPLVKARHRGWMEFGSSILADIWVVETTADEALYAQKLATLKQKFARVEAELEAGPFFGGADFSIVDAVFAPIFRYFDVFEEMAGLGTLRGFAKLTAWRAALSARDSVRGAVTRDYAALLKTFVMNKNGCLAASAKRLSKASSM